MAYYCRTLLTLVTSWIHEGKQTWPSGLVSNSGETCIGLHSEAMHNYHKPSIINPTVQISWLTFQTNVGQTLM